MRFLFQLLDGNPTGQASRIPDQHVVVEDAYRDRFRGPQVSTMHKCIDHGFEKSIQRVVPDLAAMDDWRIRIAANLSADVVAHLQVLTELPHDGVELVEQRALEHPVIENRDAILEPSHVNVGGDEAALWMAAEKEDRRVGQLTLIHKAELPKDQDQGLFVP